MPRIPFFSPDAQWVGFFSGGKLKKITEQPLAAPAHEYNTPRISPDGHRVGVGSENQVWLYDLARAVDNQRGPPDSMLLVTGRAWCGWDGRGLPCP
jgi:hypothetical protein